MIGRLIVLEGSEGAGKSSAYKKLELCLPSETTVFTREPGGTSLAKKIRTMLLNEKEDGTHVSEEDRIRLSARSHFTLFWAARVAHIEEIIAPALQEGKNVICDRFDASTWAYQIWGQEQPQLIRLFLNMRECFVEQYAKPYLYIYLDVDPEVGLARTRTRGVQNDFDMKTVDFYRRVEKGYNEFMSMHACRTVDANREEDVVSEEIIQIVRTALA